LSPTTARIVALSSSGLKLAAILAKLAEAFSGSRVKVASWPTAKKPRAWAMREPRVLLELQQLEEFAFGVGAGVGAGLGLGARFDALDLAGELLGEEHDQFLGALLLAVVDRVRDRVREDLERAQLLFRDGFLAPGLDLGQFGLELGGELLDGLLGGDRSPGG